MNDWECAYEKQGFEISTLKPSEVVIDVLKEKTELDNILDLGCGNGRNSIYLSQFGNIDCIDVVDRNFMSDLNSKNKVFFSKSNVVDFIYEENKYNLILMIRLIQYLSFEELKFLFKKLSISIKEAGFIAISYTCSGGIFNQEYKVKKYSHSLESLKEIFNRNMFNIVNIKKGNSQTKHVPYESKVEVYEIILKKRTT